MSTGSPSAPPEGRLTEWLLRAFGLLAYGVAVSNLAAAWWVDPTRLTLLLFVLIEGYTFLLVLLARRAGARDMAPFTVAATIYAVLFPVLLDSQDTLHLIPESAGVTLQLLGTCWQFSAKLYLGRAFGLLPAHRGLVMTGPYRLVRHPIYFGYLIGTVGFLLTNFSWRNAAVLGLLLLAHLHRLRREEVVLAASNSAYGDYQRRVRWRLLPFIY